MLDDFLEYKLNLNILMKKKHLEMCTGCILFVLLVTFSILCFMTSYVTCGAAYDCIQLTHHLPSAVRCAPVVDWRRHVLCTSAGAPPCKRDHVTVALVYQHWHQQVVLLCQKTYHPMSCNFSTFHTCFTRTCTYNVHVGTCTCTCTYRLCQIWGITEVATLKLRHC